MIKNTHSNSMEITRRYLDTLVVEGRILGSVHPSARVSLLGMEFETPVMGADREEIFSRIFCAEKNGAAALAIDVEHATNSEDDRDSVVVGYPMKQPTLEELREYVASTTLPFFFKGVMGPKDALTAKELGAAGVILSHHNNILRCAAPHVFLLPEIRKAVGPDFILIADGGIEDGYDAFKALARGADLVSVGRPFMAPYEAEGPDGIVKVVNEFTDELKALMLRTGAKNLASIDPSVVREAYWM